MSLADFTFTEALSLPAVPRQAQPLPPKHQIQFIQERQREMLRRLVVGQPIRDIARELGCNEQTIKNVKNSQLGSQEIARLNGVANLDVIDIHKRIQEITPKAVFLLEQVVEGTVICKAADRVKAAMDILDRAGYGAVKHHIVSANHLSAEEVEELKSRGREVGLVVEAVVGGAPRQGEALQVGELRCEEQQEEKENVEDSQIS